MMEEIPDPSTTKAHESKEVACTLTSDGCSFNNGTKMKKVAIIGAGPAGLCAARHFFQPNSGFTGYVYEQAADLGGTWLYSDATGKDKFGLPLHSTLYYDLWTNLPKDTMTYPDFPFEDERTYLPASRILQYLMDYADHYNLHKHIKYQHHVTRIAPLGNSWSVSVVELNTQIEHVTMFDAVIICSGPNIIPVYPQVDGLARFSGKQIHSKEFRKASAFEGKRILIIGYGPSGLDISLCVLPVAKQVFISHNLVSLQDHLLPSSVKVKPIVTSMQDKTVTFSDGSEEEFDVIIHCTGYTYHYPFLTESCSLIVDQYVAPLYRHFINIEHPTMCLVGIPRKCPLWYMVDYQVRTFKNILLGQASLPSKDEMRLEMEKDIAVRAAEGQRKKDYHKMRTDRNEEYFKQLAELGGLNPITPVILKIFNDSFKNAIKDFINFRKTIYKIIDDENFIKTPVTTIQNVCVRFADEQSRSNENEENIIEEEKEEEEEKVSVNIDNKEEKNMANIALEGVQEEEQKKEANDSADSKEEKNMANVSLKETQEDEQNLETDSVDGIMIMQNDVTTVIIDNNYEEKNLTEQKQGMHYEKIEVEAFVEIIRPATEGACMSSSDEESKNEENLNTNLINDKRLNLEIEDSLVKSNCGDGIVKIIKTEEGGGIR